MPGQAILPKVKSLAWEVTVKDGDETHHVRTVVGYYAAWVWRETAYIVRPDSLGREPVGTTIEDARAAAQADFDSKILGCLIF